MSTSREQIHMYLFAELCNKNLLDCEENIGMKLIKNVGLNDPVFYKQHEKYSTEYVEQMLDDMDRRGELKNYSNNELYHLHVQHAKIVGLNAYYTIQNIVELDDFIILITFISSRDMNTISIVDEKFEISVKINRKKYISPGHYLLNNTSIKNENSSILKQGYITPKIWKGYEPIVEELLEFSIHLNANIPKEIPIKKMDDTFQFIFREIAQFYNPPIFKRGDDVV